MKRKPHWTQTPEGKIKMKEARLRRESEARTRAAARSQHGDRGIAWAIPPSSPARETLVEEAIDGVWKGLTLRSKIDLLLKA